MAIPALKTSKTEVEPDVIRHQARCAESFAYFLRMEVRTIDPQEGIYERPLPDWDYIYETAEAWQNHNRTILLKSRQLMLSWELAAFALWLSIYYPPSQFLLISKGGRYSKEIGDRVEYIKNNLSFADDITMKKNAKYTEYVFPGIQNNKIICLPADEDVTRTFSPSAIGFDEAAFFPYARQIMASIGPLLEEKVKFICLSTPNGEDPIFYDMWNDDSDSYKIALHYSQRPDRGPEWVKSAKRRPGMTPQQWAREYEHSFATPAGRPVYEIWNATQAQKCFDRYNPEKPLIRSFDRGYDDPAAIWGQVNDDDQLMILHSIKGDHVARDPWLKHCRELTKSLFPDHQKGYLDYGAADFSKPESDGESWRKVMKQYGIHLLDAQRDDIDRRIASVMTKMALREDGKFGIIVDPDHCENLIKGLSGGYCWPDKPDHQGKLKPIKNKFSHEVDCLGHICDNHFKVVEVEEDLISPTVDQKFANISGRPL